MEPIQRLYKKGNLITRSLHIDEDLYNKLQYLSDNVYDASVSKLINVCIETSLLHKDRVKYYKKPYKTDSIYRSIMLREEFYEELIRLKDETGISFSRLVHGSIKEFLDKYDGRAFKVKEYYIKN